MKKYEIMICPHCLHPYVLGITGTVDGCDECMSIVRNPLDHTVIEEEDNDFNTDRD
jgi:hypothetical protein